MSIDSLQIFKSAYAANQTPCNEIFQLLPPLFESLHMCAPEEIHRAVFFDISRCVRAGTVLTPQACSKLKALATTYQQGVEKDFQAIFSSDCIANAKEHLDHLGSTHLRFARAYADEFFRHNQAQEAYVSYPETCGLFLTVFLNDYNFLSSSIESDPNFYIRLPTLAIEYLLIKEERKAPEIFQSQRDRIYKMSRTYKDLSSSERENLHKRLLGDDDVELLPVTLELYKSIYICQNELSLQDLRGPDHFLYCESERALKLLKEVAPTCSRQEAAQSIVNWYLDNPEVHLKDLPLPFQREAVINQMSQMKNFQNKDTLEYLCLKLAENLELRPWLDALIA